jgi:hypothetical protein
LSHVFRLAGGIVVSNVLLCGAVCCQFDGIHLSPLSPGSRTV